MALSSQAIQITKQKFIHFSIHQIDQSPDFELKIFQFEKEIKSRIFFSCILQDVEILSPQNFNRNPLLRKLLFLNWPFKLAIT